MQNGDVASMLQSIESRLMNTMTLTLADVRGQLETLHERVEVVDVTQTEHGSKLDQHEERLGKLESGGHTGGLNHALQRCKVLENVIEQQQI